MGYGWSGKQKYEQLVEVKLSLEMEISTYRSILEDEEKRIKREGGSSERRSAEERRGRRGESEERRSRRETSSPVRKSKRSASPVLKKSIRDRLGPSTNGAGGSPRPESRGVKERLGAVKEETRNGGRSKVGLFSRQGTSSQ